MPADLDQFRSENSYGAVVGRKGLVELRHMPANRGLLFDEIDLIAGLGEVERGLHAGNATAHDHDGAYRLHIG